MHNLFAWFIAVLTSILLLQYIQAKQEKKLYLAQLGFDTGKGESEDDKLRKIVVSFASLLQFNNLLTHFRGAGHEVFVVRTLRNAKILLYDGV